MTDHTPQIYKVMWNGNKQVQGTWGLATHTQRYFCNTIIYTIQSIQAIRLYMYMNRNLERTLGPKSGHMKTKELPDPNATTILPCFPWTQHVLHLGENHGRDLLWCHNLVLSLHLSHSSVSLSSWEPPVYQQKPLRHR